MAIYKVTHGIKYDYYSVLGFKFKKLNSNYYHETALLRQAGDIPLAAGGVSLRANFSEISGESQVAKDFCSLLDYGKIPYDKNEFHHLGVCPKYKNLINFSVFDYIKHPQYNNATFMAWEFESGMLEARPYLFDNINSVIVHSNFCYEYFKQIIPSHIKLIKILYPYRFVVPSCSVAEVRKRYQLTDDDFVLFFNFSYFSSYYRKNPELLLEVFKKSLGQCSNAKLFIKTNGVRERYRNMMLSKISELGLDSQLILEEKSLSRQEMIDVMNMSDLYVSLHRGEGLGLGMLEAMSLGKTVVATDYGGNREFVKNEFAFPIDYRLIKPEQIDLKEYRFVQKWADPDKEQCVETLRSLFADRSKCAEMGKKARNFVHNTYSYENVLKIFKNNFQFLE